MKDNEVELNYWAIDFWPGLVIGMSVENYPHLKRKNLVFYLICLRVAWVKQIVDENEINQQQ